MELSQGPRATRLAKWGVDPLEDKVRDVPTFQSRRIKVQASHCHPFAGVILNEGWRAVHTDWRGALLDKCYLIPVLSDHDIEWTKTVMDDKVMLKDILTFETVNFVFKYELYGLFHEDLNELFGIERPGLWSEGIDEVDHV